MRALPADGKIAGESIEKDGKCSRNVIGGGHNSSLEDTLGEPMASPVTVTVECAGNPLAQR